MIPLIVSDTAAPALLNAPTLLSASLIPLSNSVPVAALCSSPSWAALTSPAPLSAPPPSPVFGAVFLLPLALILLCSKVLGVENRSPLPGSPDNVDCKSGFCISLVPSVALPPV